MRSILLLAFLLVSACTCLFSQQKGYYRTPCVHGNIVIFSAEGDLWKYDLSSKLASRLTTHSGLEINPSISPDGKQLAFLGQYEGATEVYVMPTDGGIPKRVSYDYNSYHIQIEGWTKDGKILYRTDKYSELPSPQLATLDPVTRTSEQIPLWQASDGCYDETGILYFTRFPNQGSKTKRYKGGLIEQIWKFDGHSEAVNITGDFEGTSTDPMIYNDNIYFLSDRDGTMNIWSMDKNGKSLKQQTFSKGWDIQTPSIYKNTIIYQKGADIWTYDITANKEEMLDINLLSDFDQRKPRWIKSPVTSITYSDISPNGNYAAIISRGRLFVSPSKSDRWVEVSRKSGVRFKEVHFINNKELAVLSDESGEYEVWKMTADGSGTPEQITKNSKTIISSFAVSPNEQYIAYNDKNDVLRVADTRTGTVKFTYDSAYSGNYEFSWSPNSRFFTYTAGIENQNAQIKVLDMTNMISIPVTTSRLNSFMPSWSADSSWLYFVSERNLHTKVNSPWGSRQPEPYYSETANIYAIPLDSTAKFPFLQKDSWLSDSVYSDVIKADSTKAGKQKKQKQKEKILQSLRLYDWKMAAKSVFKVPVKSANIRSFAVANNYLYWIDAPDDNNGAGKLYALKTEESKKYEPIEVATGVNGFSLSANNKKLLVMFANRTIAIADADGKKINVEESKLVLDNWSFLVNPIDDWKEMFADAWRMMRDYFYDRKMHNTNWTEIRKQYEPLVSRISDRNDLDDLLSQMVGELSALHTFVGGGDKRMSPDQIQIGFLGAIIKKGDKGAVIQHIYKSDPDYPDFSSPLKKPGSKIEEGDIITAVNNVPANSVTDIAELLANKVNIPVKLNLLNKNMMPYEAVVRPFSASDQYSLKYEEWELGRRIKVDSLSSDSIGYVHLRAMGSYDMDAFVKQYYPVFNRSGLIIDVRHNFGGNIDSWILEKLMRKAWMYWQSRSGGPTWNMQYAFRGPMVILCDQATSSDGEAICEGFRRLGLGKVVGMRTWGGEIWLSMDNTLVDNGIASAAEMGVFGPETKWLIEGRGVEPDITVDNLPYETFKGKDAQLEFAIDFLKKAIKANPVTAPKVPPYPDKSFDYKNK